MPTIVEQYTEIIDGVEYTVATYSNDTIVREVTPTKTSEPIVEAVLTKEQAAIYKTEADVEYLICLQETGGK